MPEDPIQLDRKQAFLLYATFCGDVERTAHALNVSPVAVLRVADDEHWNDKLRSIMELKKSQRPGDLERAINRALNFVQAHRMRLFVERVLQKVESMSETELKEYVFEAEKHTKDGVVRVQQLNTKPLADLVAAMEKAQALTYMALSDTATERVKRAEVASEGNTASASEMHAKIAAAMDDVAGSQSPRAMLFDSQLSAGRQAKEESAKREAEAAKPDPYNEDH